MATGLKDKKDSEPVKTKVPGPVKLKVEEVNKTVEFDVPDTRICGAMTVGRDSEKFVPLRIILKESDQKKGVKGLIVGVTLWSVVNLLITTQSQLEFNFLKIEQMYGSGMVKGLTGDTKIGISYPTSSDPYQYQRIEFTLAERVL
ncbi:hypothetical protein H4Q26_006621 [Puccinia striiformis f. sp. tritici PST-130]|nr:hypothetical protein H4Q26_006621 [Puccinia striiformis f. sp. tritici PST-130]